MEYLDPTKVSPDNYKLLLENDHVRVIEMTLKAGESDEMHSHRNETVYFDKGGSVVVHLPDGAGAPRRLRHVARGLDPQSAERRHDRHPSDHRRTQVAREAAAPIEPKAKRGGSDFSLPAYRPWETAPRRSHGD